jgi:hypothetical protein
MPLGVETAPGKRMRRWLGCLVIVLCGLAGCASQKPPWQASPDDEAAYTALNPYYLEFCALSEIEKKPGYGADIRGGVGGHSTIYLNGVCRTEEVYPVLAVCGHDPGANGVGLSVNSHFANANWVAIPGREFFYHGDLRPGEKLTRAAYDATKAHAQRLGLYDGVRFHDVVFADMPAGYTQEAFKYEVSIATDYAIGYGRDRFCARVPVTAVQMDRMVAYLNGLNRPYRDGEAVYRWSVLTDNCIHVAHNALAWIGFWPVWPMHRFVLLAAFDFPVPKNEFVNIMRRANDMPIEDLLAVWDDRPARRAVLAGHGLPTRPGALATFERVVQDNALYNTDLRLIFYDEPVFGHYETWFRRILAEPRYTDLAADLRYYRARFDRIEAGRRSLQWWLGAYPALRSQPDFPVFYARFYEAVGEAERRAGSDPVLAASGGRG